LANPKIVKHFYLSITYGTTTLFLTILRDYFMKSIVSLIIKSTAFIFAGFIFSASAQSATVNHRNQDLVPTGKGWGEAPLFAADPSGIPALPALLDNSEIYGSKISGSSNVNNYTPVGYGISYHGGPLITATAHIYYIWYGDWTNNTGPAILNTLAQKIGGSPRYNINTTYSNGSNVKVSNSVTLQGSTSVGYPYGNALTDSNILAVVQNAISSGKLPKDANGIYYVLTSKDVNETSGFGTKYCGWHSYASIARTNIKFAFVGDPTVIAPYGCEAQTVSPNDNPGADAMASVIVHELEESVTDPNFNAWYDSLGYENSDKCAWTFGVTTTLANLSQYNMTLGGLNYLIQQNWVNSAPGYCALTY
jgi:hypothetical protein